MLERYVGAVGIYRDCDERKTRLNAKKDHVGLIDPDGPNGDSDGNLPPALVFCDVRTYPHVAVTILHHDR